MSGFEDVLRTLDPVTLGELNDSAELLSRVDRKYFVPRALLAEVLAANHDELRVLEIEHRRWFRYRTVYFDSPDFVFFRQHAQGRRHRFKVRTRTYCDSGDCLLEVKSKGYRGRTVKQRIPHDVLEPYRLDAPGLEFVGSITGADAATLVPVVETVYRRATLRHAAQRITLDIDLECSARVGGERGAAPNHGPNEVLVETKSLTGSGPIDRDLLRAGVRAHSVSKYCVAASLSYPELPTNRWQPTLRRYFGGAQSGEVAGRRTPLGARPLVAANFGARGYCDRPRQV